ncbi:hypothetical protein [Aurantivibrio infirmus]
MIHLRRFYLIVSFLSIYVIGLQNANAELSFGTIISASYDYQSLGDDYADLSTLSLSPNMSAGNWYFAIDIPWQKVDGDISQNQRPRLDEICSLLNTGRQLPPRLSNLRNSILQYCSTQSLSDGSGLSDISVVASYGLSHGPSSAWFSSFSFTYQGDNGETQKGLGSGTQDGSFEWTLQGDHSHISLSFNLGYNFILGGEYKDFYDDYAFASFSLSSPIHKPLIFGASYQFQQSSAEHIDDLSSLDFFGEFNFSKRYALRVSYLNYLDADFYPDYSVNTALYISF